MIKVNFSKQLNSGEHIFFCEKTLLKPTNIIKIAENGELIELIMKLSSFIIDKYEINKNAKMEKCKLFLNNKISDFSDEKFICLLNFKVNIDSQYSCVIEGFSPIKKQLNNTDNLIIIDKLNFTINVSNNVCKINGFYKSNKDSNNFMNNLTKDIITTIITNLMKYISN